MPDNATTLSNEQIEANKKEFQELIATYVHRPGIEKLMKWLEGTDFFTAPASTKYHEPYPGGLCEHSLTVYHKLEEINSIVPEKYALSDESMAICALFHDLCKVQFYKLGSRNVKNEQTGQWEKVPWYTVEDAFPYGHSEKSVFLIERHMRLTVQEAVCINAHMGYADARGVNAIGNIFTKYPEAANLHIADLLATYQKQ